MKNIRNRQVSYKIFDEQNCIKEHKNANIFAKQGEFDPLSSDINNFYHMSK